MVTKFCNPHTNCYIGKILFAKASKIITNWLLTLQLDIFNIIGNLPKWAQENAWM